MHQERQSGKESVVTKSDNDSNNRKLITVSEYVDCIKDLHSSPQMAVIRDLSAKLEKLPKYHIGCKVYKLIFAEGNGHIFKGYKPFYVTAISGCDGSDDQLDFKYTLSKNAEPRLWMYNTLMAWENELIVRLSDANPGSDNLD